MAKKKASSKKTSTRKKSTNKKASREKTEAHPAAEAAKKKRGSGKRPDDPANVKAKPDDGKALTETPEGDETPMDVKPVSCIACRGLTCPIVNSKGPDKMRECADCGRRFKWRDPNAKE